jgi:hypothetical protein
MSFRFQKRVGLGKLIHVNFSKSGASLSLGPRGAGINIGSRGTYGHVGIPGTGMSYRQRLDTPTRRRANTPASVADAQLELLEAQIVKEGAAIAEVEADEAKLSAYDKAELNVYRAQHREHLAMLDQVHAQRRMNNIYRMMRWIVVGFVLLLLLASVARAEPQTRVYDSHGNSVGTIVPQGQGSVRYYDARGHSLGTSTTTNGTTTFYGPGGNVTGTTTAPRGVGGFHGK